MMGETKASPTIDIRSPADPSDKLGGANVNPKVSVINNINTTVDASVENEASEDLKGAGMLLS